MKTYSKNLRELLAVAYSIVRDFDQAQDIVQEVLLKLLSSPEKLPGLRNPLAFLKTCVRNESINFVHKLKTAPAFDEVVMNLKAALSQDEYREIENLLWIRSFLEQKSPEFQDAFLRHVLDGCTIRELAQEMGVTTAWLQKQFWEIKSRMRADKTLLFTIIFLKF
ncbi:MAG: RNA polymerase sigma factor [Clostridia bacterium]|nr:RNA polymerase sigma factor [Clostridia bacterium]